MDISTSTNICAFKADGSKNDIIHCVKECAKAGYKVLDINFCEAMNPSSRLRDNDWKTYVKEIATLANQLDVEFRQSHLPYYDIFANNDDDKVLLMETLIQRSIIASGMLGVKWAVTHPGTVYHVGNNTKISLERNVQYYSKHLATARQVGVGIALENDFEYRSSPYRRIFAASIEELCDLHDAFSDEFIGICYDFGHANLTGGFHIQNLEMIGDRLKAVHVQDNHGQSDEHLMPFFGNINWQEAMYGLAKIGYQGDLTYEIQEFGKYLPNEMKHTVVDYSLTIAEYLVSLYEKEKSKLK